MTESFDMVRNSILPNLLASEAASAHAVYPHRIFEVGKIAVRDPAANEGSHTWNALAFLIADREAGFNEVDAHLLALFYYLSLEPQLVPVEDPRFIAGRAAEIRVNGQPRGHHGRGPSAVSCQLGHRDALRGRGAAAGRHARRVVMEAHISVVPLSWQDGANIIVGQSHFIKTVEDLAEIMAATVPGAKYGLAFCEASGPCLVRTEGNDPALVADAVRCAEAVAAGHTFFLVLKNAFPINVLDPDQGLPRGLPHLLRNRQPRAGPRRRERIRAGESWA